MSLAADNGNRQQPKWTQRLPEHLLFSVLVVMFLCLVGTLAVIPVQADEIAIAVTTTADDINDDGFCSLREAIRSANLDMTSGSMLGECPAGGGADTIILPAEIYTLTIAGENENAALTGDLDITSTLTVNGAGSSLTIIDGGNLDRVIDINDHLTTLTSIVELRNVTVRGGRLGYPYHSSDGQGGGIWNGEALLLVESAIRDNLISGGCCGDGILGGGIFNSGFLTMTNSIVMSNVTGGGGGGGTIRGMGIFNQGDLSIDHSLILSNTTSSFGIGGGIYNQAGTVTIYSSFVSTNMDTGISNNGTLKLFSTTVSKNASSGIWTPGILTITASAIVSNSSGISVPCCAAYVSSLINSTVSGNGDGLALAFGDPSATVSLSNVTLANNTRGIYNVWGVGNMRLTNVILTQNGQDTCNGAYLYSLGYNLISSGCAITGTLTGNIIGANPNLGPLQNNGGPTPTHALLLGSPAIDAGDPAGCVDEVGNLLTTDQRGWFRPGHSDGSAICDIGAYEYGAVEPQYWYLPIIRR